MASCIERDQKFKKILKWMKLVYIFGGVCVGAWGFLHDNPYQWLLALATFSLFPGMYLVRKLFKWNGGWALETFIYGFSLLGWTLGGAGEVYSIIPFYDKLVHCLSGVFVSVLSLALYRMLERGHSSEGKNPLTEIVFVFAASMAVAGLFELCEFTLAPIMHRDLQHVLDTGVADTMWDMIVCLIGTLVTLLLMHSTRRGKRCFLIDAAEAFALENPKH